MLFKNRYIWKLVVSLEIYIWNRVSNFMLMLCYVEDLIFLENNKVWYWNWVHFIYRLFMLFISTFSFSLILYTVSWRYKRDYLNISIDILFNIMFYIHDEETPYSFILLSYLRSKKGPNLKLTFPVHYLQLRPWLVLIFSFWKFQFRCL